MTTLDDTKAIPAQHTVVRSAGGMKQHYREAIIGWLMASPAIGLIVPFIMAFVWSFTNQRLISPNPTEYVGTKNFTDLLTLRTITLHPIKDETTGDLVRDADGNLTYPKLRDYTRNEEKYLNILSSKSGSRGRLAIINTISLPKIPYLCRCPKIRLPLCW